MPKREDDDYLEEDTVASIAVASYKEANGATPPPNASSNVLKLARDMPFRPRFIEHYGHDETLFQHLLGYREAWEKQMFLIDEEVVKLDAQRDLYPTRELSEISAFALAIPLIKETNLTKSAFHKAFGASQTLQVTANKDSSSVEVALLFSDSVNLSGIGRNATAINTGGYIACLKWLPQPFLSQNSHSYLAVSVINSPKYCLHELTNNPQLGLFKKTVDPSEVTACLQIWSYDNQTSTLALDRVLVTSSLGVTTDLSWLPVSVVNDDSEEVLGVLAGSFADGNLHFFKIAANSTGTTVYLEVHKPSLTYSIPDERLDKNTVTVPITAYDFLGRNKILAGSLDGSFAEFILPGFGETDGSESDISIPSYIEALTDSAIVSITTGNTAKDSYFVLVNTAGPQNFYFEYENARHSKIESVHTVTLSRAIYHHTLKIFTYIDSVESLGYSFARHPHENTTLVLKTDVITAFHISEFLGHPLALSGNALGELQIVNISRRLLATSRVLSKMTNPLRMWSLSINETDRSLVLNGDFELGPPEKAKSKIAVGPPEVVFSSIAWNESFSSSSAYAAGTLSGLLLVERLDPKWV